MISYLTERYLAWFYSFSTTTGAGAVTESGLVLGMGEKRVEILAAMADLREASCEMLILGQYLQPSNRHHPVVRYITPEEFTDLGRLGERMGFRAVFAAPLVRSSFHAAELLAKSLFS